MDAHRAGAEVADEAAAHAARSAGDAARRRATPHLVAVLHRYPPAPAGRTRVARLMASLDVDLRSGQAS